jgi:hypothetical protein
VAVRGVVTGETAPAEGPAIGLGITGAVVHIVALASVYHRGTVPSIAAFHDAAHFLSVEQAVGGVRGAEVDHDPAEHGHPGQQAELDGRRGTEHMQLLSCSRSRGADHRADLLEAPFNPF